MREQQTIEAIDPTRAEVTSEQPFKIPLGAAIEKPLTLARADVDSRASLEIQRGYLERRAGWPMRSSM